MKETIRHGTSTSGTTGSSEMSIEAEEERRGRERARIVEITYASLEEWIVITCGPKLMTTRVELILTARSLFSLPSESHAGRSGQPRRRRIPPLAEGPATQRCLLPPITAHLSSPREEQRARQSTTRVSRVESRLVNILSTVEAKLRARYKERLDNAAARKEELRKQLEAIGASHEAAQQNKLASVA